MLENFEPPNRGKTSAVQIDGRIPPSLERSEVPRYFRQFRDASVLKKLAHARKGPLYQLIGRKAWYETADIVAWLDARKGAGPAKPREPSERAAAPPVKGVAQPKKRLGRPTKTEQARRARGQP